MKATLKFFASLVTGFVFVFTFVLSILVGCVFIVFFPIVALSMLGAMVITGLFIAIVSRKIIHRKH